MCQSEDITIVLDWLDTTRISMSHSKIQQIGDASLVTAIIYRNGTCWIDISRQWCPQNLHVREMVVLRHRDFKCAKKKAYLLTVYFYHVTYVFSREFTLYSCLALINFSIFLVTCFFRNIRKLIWLTIYINFLSLLIFLILFWLLPCSY